jgi:hypothetical protein
LPLDERRAVLEDEIMGRDLIYPARRLPDHGLEAWAMVKEQGWDGMVAKDPTAPCSEGSTWRWLKVKVRHEGRFIVGRHAVGEPGDGPTGGPAPTGTSLLSGHGGVGACSARWSRSCGQRGRAGAAQLTLR